jgi:hypothetical protein
MYPERVTAARLRGMACRMTRGFPGSASLRNTLGGTRSSEELFGVLTSFAAAAPASASSALEGGAAEPARAA